MCAGARSALISAVVATRGAALQKGVDAASERALELDDWAGAAGGDGAPAMKLG